MKVYLRAFEPEDFHLINTWRRDEETYRFTAGSRYFVSSERDRQWVLEKIAGNESELYLAICLVADGRMIGYISLSSIDYRNRRGDWSGIVIGEEAFRGQGFASDAIYLLLQYAFDELGLERVSGTWLAENTGSLFVGRMMGFRQEGVLREHVYKNGKRHDVVMMSMLRGEFELLRARYGGSGEGSGS